MLIGVTGYARSGKDTIGEILVRNHGFERFGFADAVKEGVYAMNPWVPMEVEKPSQIILGQKPKYEMRLRRLQEVVDEFGWELAKANPEVRRLCQVYGTEAGRDIHGKDCWIDAAFRNIPYGTKGVFTDCRFINEAAAIQEDGGTIWRVTRPGVQAESGHSSETELDKIVPDAWILNDGSLKDLEEKVAALAPIELAA